MITDNRKRVQDIKPRRSCFLLPAIQRIMQLGNKRTQESGRGTFLQNFSKSKEEREGRLLR